MIFADATNAILYTGLALACVVVGVAIIATRKRPIEENCLVQAQLERIEKKLAELTSENNQATNTNNLNGVDLEKLRLEIRKQFADLTTEVNREREYAADVTITERPKPCPATPTESRCQTPISGGG